MESYLGALSTKDHERQGTTSDDETEQDYYSL